eukprot:CAMPEP_0204040448 /NCGR_PEP_ID=MMETSP0360-20130528/92048_1 /ASSEMBLY_ACC=CAM_ASM_000342 /TAXON_ID=268821 /ORGANISM="Scrippsiella Hangoei, Strain SHTV-5" /LENGTH=44 /DNA_ID= /DNA_START= /DNA_END= /DNA_ORIENTATION=
MAHTLHWDDDFANGDRSTTLRRVMAARLPSLESSPPFRKRGDAD